MWLYSVARKLLGANLVDEVASISQCGWVPDFHDPFDPQEQVYAIMTRVHVIKMLHVRFSNLRIFAWHRMEQTSFTSTYVLTSDIQE